MLTFQLFKTETKTKNKTKPKQNEEKERNKRLKTAFVFMLTSSLRIETIFSFSKFVKLGGCEVV
ncbi:MAG: hypothetical protein ACTS6G_01105 [Candidatus Hodgkinia cicadicola]